MPHVHNTMIFLLNDDNVITLMMTATGSLSIILSYRNVGRRDQTSAEYIWECGIWVLGNCDWLERHTSAFRTDRLNLQSVTCTLALRKFIYCLFLFTAIFY